MFLTHWLCPSRSRLVAPPPRNLDPGRSKLSLAPENILSSVSGSMGIYIYISIYKPIYRTIYNMDKYIHINVQTYTHIHIYIYIYIYEELFSKTRYASIQKSRLQWQCHARSSCFGKELFINMYLYASIHMFWKRALHIYIYIYIDTWGSI